MKSKFSRELPDAFVIDDKVLRKLIAILGEGIGPARISADCADGATREFETLDELLGYENAVSTRIQRLRLSFHSEKLYERAAHVDFTGKGFASGVDVSIEGRDEEVTSLRTKVLDVIGGTRPWYRWVNRLNPVTAFPVFLGLMWVGVAGWEAIYGWQPDPPGHWKLNDATKQLIGFCVSFAGFGLLYGLYKLRNRVFPHGTFRIGQGTGRDDTLEKWRWGVAVSFVVSIVAGVVTLAW